jgi:nitrous oxidase accessory protein
MRILTNREFKPDRLRLAFIAGLLILVLFSIPAISTNAQAQSGERVPDIVVCPSCSITSIVDAIELASPGALIEVRGGVYAGAVLIDRDVELTGVDDPVIDGGGVGSIVTVQEATVSISGFTIRGTGTSLHREDSAIVVDSGRATIQNNRIEDALFGIYVKNSPGTVLRGNVVIGKDISVASRGDGIRVWYCDDMVIENNIVQDGRDIILWYSDRGVVRGNQFDRGRYGLHLMFSDDTIIESNSLRANSVGLYVMYSRNVVIQSNSMSDNHGPSGGGLGLKDVDGAEIVNNRFINNRIGAQVDTSPREPDLVHLWTGNVFAYNQAALGLMPAVRDNAFTDNAFIDNMENVTILGGGQLQNMTWAVDGRGNYWSDYAGYDADGDGIGDIPYRSQHLFESLTDRHPQLRLFTFSPAAMAIDFAARAFPAVQPREKFVDPAPLMSPPSSAGLPPVERSATWTRLVGAAAGLGVALGTLVVVGRVRRGSGTSTVTTEIDNEGTHMPDPAPDTAPAASDSTPAVSVASLSKLYGDVAAVDDVNFEIVPGEAVAMWGPNGAGKTTILRCLLGVARFSGDIRVNGFDPVTQGRLARATIGFVPQDLAPSPVPVEELANFIARLKGATSAEAMDRLARLGIDDQARKPVSALSGGMKQRLALALALIGEPKVLLLDEPTANLDAAGRASLIALLRDLKRDGMTLVFSSHRPDDVLALADRILMMERGELVRDVTPDMFTVLLDAGSRLVMTLSNGHVDTAVSTLAQLGYSASVAGQVLTVAVKSGQKANVISTLAKAGVEIDDFEVERSL